MSLTNLGTLKDDGPTRFTLREREYQYKQSVK